MKREDAHLAFSEATLAKERRGGPQIRGVLEHADDVEPVAAVALDGVAVQRQRANLRQPFELIHLRLCLIRAAISRHNTIILSGLEIRNPIEVRVRTDTQIMYSNEVYVSTTEV